jgi:hypothetical protein
MHLSKPHAPVSMLRCGSNCPSPVSRQDPCSGRSWRMLSKNRMSEIAVLLRGRSRRTGSVKADGTSPGFAIGQGAEWDCAVDSRQISHVLAGGSLRDVQLLAGHRSIQTTQRYIDGDTDAQRKLVSIGEAHGCSAAAIALAWAIRSGGRTALPELSSMTMPADFGWRPPDRTMHSASACVAGGIIDVEEPETSAQAVCPLKIVHQAPMEIAAHRHALRGRAL